MSRYADIIAIDLFCVWDPKLFEKLELPSEKFVVMSPEGSCRLRRDLELLVIVSRQVLSYKG